MHDDGPDYTELEPGGADLYEPPESFNGMHQSARAVPYPITLLRDLDDHLTKEWLVKDMLGVGELSDVFGAPGSGKSVLIGDLAYHVAAGIDWHGRRVMQSAVLVVAAERRELVERRMLALRKTYGHDDAPLAVIGGSFALAHKGDDKDRLIATAEQLGQSVGIPCRWIVLDTKNRVMAGADENSAKDMSALVANLDEIQRATGAHITLIDHMPHEGQRMRGHGALLGACDSTFKISKAGEFRTLEIDKVNDGPTGLKFTYRMRSVQIGYDHEAGEATTAPIVEPVEGEVLEKEADGKKRLTKSATIALNALLKAIDEAGEVPPASNHIPSETRTVSMEKWREYAERMGISPAGKPDAVRIAFKRASETLIASGHVASWSPYVWPTK